MQPPQAYLNETIHNYWNLSTCLEMIIHIVIPSCTTSGAENTSQETISIKKSQEYSSWRLCEELNWWVGTCQKKWGGVEFATRV